MNNCTAWSDHQCTTLCNILIEGQGQQRLHLPLNYAHSLACYISYKSPVLAVFEISNDILIQVVKNMGILVLVGWSLTTSGRNKSAKIARLVTHSCNSSVYKSFHGYRTHSQSVNQTTQRRGKCLD